MKLNRDFLCNALPEATFQLGDITLSSVPSNQHNSQWQSIDQGCDVMVSMDTRTTQPGDFFIALRGPNFDGHTFLQHALAKGACGALVSRQSMHHVTQLTAQERAGKLFIIVHETLDAYIALAKAWRNTLTCPVVGITGSVGKTSTKEIVRCILDVAGVDAYVSFKNFNNVFGICYNVLRIPATAAVAVIEVGINEKGEMIQLADILRPTIGVITNIGHAHMEGLGNSLRGVSAEKRNLFALFTPHNVGIVCGDQPLLGDLNYAHPTARFGVKIKNHVQARKIRTIQAADGSFTTTFSLKWYGQKAVINVHGNHKGFVHNALAASTVAYFLHIPFEKVIEGLQVYKGFEHRFEMKKLKGAGGHLLNDCYNANPESMKAALLAFAQMDFEGQKIAVLGDMLELGDKTAYWHRQMGRVISKTGNVQRLILVGENAKLIGSTVPDELAISFAKDWQEAHAVLTGLLAARESLVLVKASHGIHLDLMVKEVVE